MNTLWICSYIKLQMALKSVLHLLNHDQMNWNCLYALPDRMSGSMWTRYPAERNWPRILSTICPEVWCEMINTRLLPLLSASFAEIKKKSLTHNTLSFITYLKLWEFVTANVLLERCRTGLQWNANKLQTHLLSMRVLMFVYCILLHSHYESFSALTQLDDSNGIRPIKKSHR